MQHDVHWKGGHTNGEAHTSEVIYRYDFVHQSLSVSTTFNPQNGHINEFLLCLLQQVMQYTVPSKPKWFSNCCKLPV